MNNDEAVVEEIRMSDLHASDENLVCSASGGEVRDLARSLGSDSDATAGTQGLDLGTESELSEIVDGEESRNKVFAKEVRDGARNASAERGIGGSEESRRTGPGSGGG